MNDKQLQMKLGLYHPGNPKIHFFTYLKYFTSPHTSAVLLFNPFTC